MSVPEDPRQPEAGTEGDRRLAESGRQGYYRTGRVRILGAEEAGALVRRSISEEEISELSATEVEWSKPADPTQLPGGSYSSPGNGGIDTWEEKGQVEPEPALSELAVGDDAQSEPESFELPHWTDPPTGQVPRILLSEDEDEGDGDDQWAAISGPAPTWREHDTEWEAADFHPGFLEDDEEVRTGVLDEMSQGEMTDAFDDLHEATQAKVAADRADLSSQETQGEPSYRAASGGYSPEGYREAELYEEELYEQESAYLQSRTGEWPSTTDLGEHARGDFEDDPHSEQLKEPESRKAAIRDDPESRDDRVTGASRASVGDRGTQDGDQEPSGEPVLARQASQARRRRHRRSQLARRRSARRSRGGSRSTRPAPPSPGESSGSAGSLSHPEGSDTNRPLQAGPAAAGFAGGASEPRLSPGVLSQPSLGSNGLPARHQRTPERVRPPAPAQEGSQRNVALALVTGIGIALVALGCFALGSLATLIFSTVVILGAAAEAFTALRRAGYRPATLIGLLGTAAIVLAAYSRGIASIPLVVALVIVFALLWNLAGVLGGSAAANLGATLLAFAWIGVLGSFAGLVLAPSLFPNRNGVAFFLGAVVATVSYDVGALAVGSWLGRHKLAPRVSPSKTWEGLVGGSVVAIAVSALVVSRVYPWTTTHAILLGVIVCVFAPLGDLCESLIKRDLALKDMGSLLPGHGGVLDRIDSLLFVFPATYYFLVLIHAH